MQKGFLVVDDVSINVFVVKEMLAHYGLPVDTAASGTEAIDKIKQGNVYDIIFMDHMMPDLNGTEATKVIREMGYTGCIVALTAHAPGENDEDFLKSGFDRHISKPIDLDELDDLVKEYTDYDGENGSSGESAMPGLSEVEGYFIEDAQYAIETLEELYAGNRTLTPDDIDTYETTVHGMKSALLNINQPDLSKEAYMLEMAAKSSNTEMMETETPAFMEKLKKLLDTMMSRQ